MATIKVKEGAYERYSQITWQGEVEINKETLTYRYSEDNNGAELFILQDGHWNSADVDEESGNDNHKLLFKAIMAWGSPTELGSDGEVSEVLEEELDDWI